MTAMLPSGWNRWLYDATVVSAHDGDTVTLKADVGFGITFDIVCRISGIQAPEVGGADVTDEEKAAGFGVRDYLRSMMPAGSSCFIETFKDAKEGRGRYLAKIWAGGVEISEHLIEKGMACRYDGKGKAPKWVAPNRWRRTDGALIDSRGFIQAP